MATEIKLGWILELIPHDPPPLMEGQTLVGEVVLLDLPVFSLACPGIPGQLRFRVDRNGELAVRFGSSSLSNPVYEIGRTCRHDERL